MIDMIDLDDIARAFTFILSKGFVPSVDDYKPQEFGNATLVMAGAPFSLRFIRDRGQVFVDVGNKTVGWYKLEYALEFVDNSITEQQLGEPPDPIALANLLEAHWQNVEVLFGDPQKISQLQAITKQKTAMLLTKIFKNGQKWPDSN